MKSNELSGVVIPETCVDDIPETMTSTTEAQTCLNTESVFQDEPYISLKIS
ncbi:hypothetical protein KJB35_01990 [Vibrio sp. D431a]|nr:hypothetical protein [Vibrio sp. D431a]